MNTKELLETIARRESDLVGMKKIQADLAADIASLVAYIDSLKQEANGAYQGQNHYTDEQRRQVRCGIRIATSTQAKSVGEICQTMPDYERGLIEKEVRYLCARKALIWNGKVGSGSKYQATFPLAGD